ncbi:MAG: hypothetical protein KTR31_20785 [Myxococcales bacterium]|nr:hypothetical protein [Myxococcales bacterium]
MTCRAYHEFAADHPVPVDPDGIEALIRSPDLLARIELAWQQADFSGPQVLVLESRLFQMAAMYPLLADVPPAEIHALIRRLHDGLAARNPLLVFFDHSDPASAVGQVLGAPERQEWRAWATSLASRLPWLQRRTLSGEAGWTRFVQHWATLLADLFEAAPCQKVRVLDASRDWAAAQRTVDRAVGLAAHRAVGSGPSPKRKH